MGVAWVRWWIALCLLACSVGTAPPSVPLYVDGQALPTTPAAFIVDGRTVAPVGAVVTALGGGVSWTGGAVDISSHPKTFMAAAVAGEAGPTGPVAPTLALTRYLAELEGRTLRASGPALVRFDILDVRFDDVMITRLKGYMPRGYTYAVRLFYETVAGGTERLYVTRTSSGTTTGGGGAASIPTHAFYEEATIGVRPAGSPVYTRAGDTTTLTYGQSGWRADPATLTVEKIVVLAAPVELVHGAVPH